MKFTKSQWKAMGHMSAKTQFAKARGFMKAAKGGFQKAESLDSRGQTQKAQVVRRRAGNRAHLSKVYYAQGKSKVAYGKGRGMANFFK